MSPLPSWQLLAHTFPVTRKLVSAGSLAQGYEPADAVALCQEPLSTYERSVLAFLLHVWNRYEHAFELSEVAAWDPDHQRAFADWVSGRTLGSPLRYF